MTLLSRVAKSSIVVKRWAKSRKKRSSHFGIIIIWNFYFQNINLINIVTSVWLDGRGRQQWYDDARYYSRQNHICRLYINLLVKRNDGDYYLLTRTLQISLKYVKNARRLCTVSEWSRESACWSRTSATLNVENKVKRLINTHRKRVTNYWPKTIGP